MVEALPVPGMAPRALKAAHDIAFNQVHRSNLIYNATWEDPRIDRELLELNAASRVVTITSAGCNVLDYLLDGPEQIFAVDMNHRQNALLELKLALIQHAPFADLFQMFGAGAHPKYAEVYQQVRPTLNVATRAFWDKQIGMFDPRSLKKSFYYHGTSGIAAWVMVKALFQARPQVRRLAERLLDSLSLREQKEIYAHLEPEIWGRISSWLVRQPTLMAFLGVPRAQISLIEQSHPGGLEGYVKDKLRHVMTEVPISDNYFWRVYLTGNYTTDCCPEYLRLQNHLMLQCCASRVSTHTMSIAQFLKANPGTYSHFILLDHQDWLAWNDTDGLREEWELILASSRPGTRILLRSASPSLDFIPADIRHHLNFHPELTRILHRQDRVGTYGSLHLAEVI
jgi:S-adenosylmethionine-diacylglycerol 3-amino-3-carboxypropyl transferase